MNKIDLGQTTQVLANLGVIIGIIFLVLELQQNNALLASQARLGQLGADVSRLQLDLDNSDMAHISFKARNGEPLTPEEEYRYGSYALYTMIHWRWEFEEYRAGILPEVNLLAWRNQSSRSPIWRRVWNTSLGAADTEFTRFVEENVFRQQ
jgi:hypothetical protein